MFLEIKSEGADGVDGVLWVTCHVSGSDALGAVKLSYTRKEVEKLYLARDVDLLSDMPLESEISGEICVV